jgi:hypothetical protein
MPMAGDAVTQHHRVAWKLRYLALKSSLTLNN